MWRADDFELGRRLGCGTFGHAQLARERRHGRTLIVLKVIKKRRVERLKVQQHVVREIEVHAHLRHKHILRFFGYFWDATRIYMMLEYAPGGDLSRLLQKEPSQRFDEPVAVGFLSQVASAIAYCHQMHVIHRDLKPQNILLGARNVLKLADFGWAVHTYPNERRWTLCGTLEYLPPEMVHNRGHSFSFDAWGLGILACELLLGRPPFTSADREETYRMILAASPSFPKDLSAGAKDFVQRLLRQSPAERLTLSQATGHPWLRSSVSTHKGGEALPGGREAAENEGGGGAALAAQGGA